MDCKNLIVERAHSSRRAEGALRVHRPHLRQRVELPVLAETVPARLQGGERALCVIKRAAAMHTQGAPQHTQRGGGPSRMRGGSTGDRAARGVGPVDAPGAPPHTCRARTAPPPPRRRRAPLSPHRSHSWKTKHIWATQYGWGHKQHLAQCPNQLSLRFPVAVHRVATVLKDPCHLRTPPRTDKFPNSYSSI